jgi:hypothetical protein
MPQAKIDRNAPLSVGPYSDEFLDETIRVWQPRSPNRKLTREDAREIISNMTGFFQVLIEWDRAERNKS